MRRIFIGVLGRNSSRAPGWRCSYSSQDRLTYYHYLTPAPASKINSQEPKS